MTQGRRRGELAQPLLSSEGWWNLWHYHADWPGWGNAGWAYRREHLRALATVFHTIAAVPPPHPFQTWISIDGGDAGQDAVYLHSPNPHSPFPLEIGSIEWGSFAVQETMATLLPDFPLRSGKCAYYDGDAMRSTFIVYSPQVGIPLERAHGPNENPR